MRTKFYHLFFSVFFVAILNDCAWSQISFPNGNTLNLNTSNGFLYLETRILFHTGNFKADDYAWNKISDSLDINWLVTACFNGDCRNDLLQNGNFIKDYGLNDTTCFIAFHIETHGINGSSKIKYKVFNKNNSADNGDLVFNINYSNATGIGLIKRSDFVIYPTTATSNITLQSSDEIANAEIKFTNILGETLLINAVSFINNKTNIDVTALSQGIYFIQLKSNDKITIQKFFKQ